MDTNAARAALLAELLMNIVSNSQDLLQNDKYLIHAGGFVDGQMVKMVRESAVSELQNLSSSQEEADARMILHVVHLSHAFDCVLVCSDDTDVLVLLLYYKSINMLDTQMYMHAGHTTQYTRRERFIPINNIVEKVGKGLCQNLPAAHALTGCDTTNSFFKIGKCVAYSKLAGLVREDPTVLTIFGLTDNVDDDVASAGKYVLLMYGNKCVPSTTLDQLRYVLA